MAAETINTPVYSANFSDAPLALFAQIYDEPGTPALQARLPVVHSEEIVRVLERFTAQPRKLGDLKGEYFATEMWHETNSQKDGTIRRETRHPKDLSEWIVQGPHFYVGTPIYKTPNEGCSTNRAYTQIDLTAIPDDYLPRTNYVPACAPEEYRRRTPTWKGRPVTEYWRHIHRRSVSPTGERTLISGVLPPGAAHVHPVLSVAFEEPRMTARISGLCGSLPFDFFIKTTGKEDVYESTLSHLPTPVLDQLDESLILRWLLLTCLTVHYRRFWDSLARDAAAPVCPTSVDRRIQRRLQVATQWSHRSAVRDALQRRQLLLEVDAIASISLGLTIEELLTIYRVQFPVLQQHERERLYDQHGRIVPTAKTASSNPCVNLVQLAAELRGQAGFDTAAEYHPGAANTEELLRQRARLSPRDAAILGVAERCTMADLMGETDVRWSDDEHPEGRPVRLVGLRYTDPGLEPRLERVYPTPWTRCDREADYRQAWTEFERRLGIAPNQEP